MDEFPGNNVDGHYDRDSLSDSLSMSHDSLLNETDTKLEKDDFSIRRKGSYTIEISPEMSQSIKERKLHKPIFVKIDSTNHNLLPERYSDIDMKCREVSSKNMMTQSMYERPWISSKRNNSIAANKQREEKLRLAKEEQVKKQLQKVVGLNETQKLSEIARKRKEEEIYRKNEERKLKALERQRIVEERKLRLAQAEEARKSRILRKMTNQDDRHNTPQISTNIMTMSCYGAVGSAKIRPGNKEVVKDRFIAKRPLSSTGKVIGFGSSSPRIICENPIKSTPKNPPKISEYLMERSQILSRPASSRISDKMTTSVMAPINSSSSNRLMVRQGSLREKRPVSAIITSTMSESIRVKPFTKSKPISIQEDVPNGMTLLSPNTRISSRKSNSAQSNKTNNSHNKSIRERPSSAKPIQHSTNSLERGIVQSKSSTFPKARSNQPNKSKVDAHLDSDSIEDEGITLTESFNQPRSITSSSVSHMKSEVNKTDLSSADSLDAEMAKCAIVNSNENVESMQTENSNSKTYISSRGLPTKDLTEADYKARLMENRRLIREKREREREQLMKAERERRHIEEATVREIIELEKSKIIIAEENHHTTSNDDAIEDQPKPSRSYGNQAEQSEDNTSVAIEIDQVDGNSETNKDLESDEKERLLRKKRLDSIMSRFKKPAEESSSEGGGISPRRAMSPELAELDTEVSTATTNPMFRSSLLQSMLNKGKLSGNNKTPSPNKEPEEIKVSQESPSISNNQFVGILPLTSLRESIEDSESLPINVNSKSSAAVRSSGIDGNSLSDANSDFIADQDNPSHSAIINNVQGNTDRGDCDGQEDGNIIKSEAFTDVVINPNGENNYSSASSIETEEDEIIKNSFNPEHLYNSHIIRPLAQEGCVFQS